MRARDWIELIQIMAWPIVFLTFAFVLRQYLPSVLQRTTKVSAFGFEIELTSAGEFSPKWSTEMLTDVRSATRADDFSSGATHLFDSPGDYDFAVVDLGNGQNWLTSRLYIFSVMLERMRV